MIAIDKEQIKIILEESDHRKISLRNFCFDINPNFDISDANLKIEILSKAKIQLLDDIIDFSALTRFSKINCDIEFILNEDSYLEYRMIVKQDFSPDVYKRFVNNCVFNKHIKFNFVGEGSHAKIRIKDMCSGGQNVNLYTEQNHLKSETSSCLCVKSVLINEAVLKCKSKIFVAQGLNEVSARQINKNLLLDPSVVIFTQPQLEVLSANVKCRHGATVKSLDAEQLFYLSLRGLNFEDSRKLLVDGFLN